MTNDEWGTEGPGERGGVGTWERESGGASRTGRTGRTGRTKSAEPVAAAEFSPNGSSVEALGDLVAEHALFHPAHGEQIVEGGEEAVPNPVVALARETGVVGDGDFRDGEAFDFEERGQEPVHAFEELEVFDALALEGAVSATGVADPLAGEF